VSLGNGDSEDRTLPSLLTVVRLCLVVLAWLYSVGALALAAIWVLHDDASRWQFVALVAAAPVVGLPAYAVLGVSIWHRHLSLIVVAGVLVALQVLAMSTVVGFGHPSTDGFRLRLLDANLMYSNTRTAGLGTEIAKLKPDVVALEEVSPTSKAGLVDVLAAYPYRVERLDGGAFGIGLYAKQPLLDTAVVQLGANAVIHAQLTTGGGQLAIEVIHTNAPRDGAGLVSWRYEMTQLRSMVSSIPHEGIVVGDFNATLSNHLMRDVLRAGDLRDAVHEAGGFWLRTWPNNVAGVPPLVDIDHV
jgi:endonuclease/exonuclease/phosphatase (EEP) superfamily protein YafD